MTEPYLAPVQPVALVPATLSDRFLARLIDTGIIFGALVIAGLILQAMEQPDGSTNPIGYLLAFGTYAAVLAYEPFLLATRGGQTVGKRMMKIKVVKQSGAALEAGGAIGRSVVPMIAGGCTCGLAGLLFDLSPTFDGSPWRRGWRDHIASTVVVRA